MIRKTIPVFIGLVLLVCGAALAAAVPICFYIGALAAAFGVLILLYTLLIRRKLRIPLIILTVLTVLSLGAFTAAEIAVLRGGRTDADGRETAVIVLGAGVNGTTPSVSLQNRLDAAYDWLTGHPDTVAVLTGGMDDIELITEAEAMFRYLTDRGIAPERLILEENATNTRENLQYSFELLGEDARAAVISSEYHLYRARRLAESMGYDVAVIAAPTSLTAMRINYTIREGLGVLYVLVFGQ